MGILLAVLRFLAFYPAHLLHTVVALVAGAFLHFSLKKLGRYLLDRFDALYIRLGF